MPEFVGLSGIKHFHTSVLLYDHYDYFRFRYPDMALRLQKELYAIDLAGLLSSLRDVAYAYWDELNRLGEFLTNLNRLPVFVFLPFPDGRNKAN